MEMPSTSAATTPAVATVFFCPLCDKPFTKEPQCKRHTAYCSKSKSRTRLRSCRACNESKIKCNYGIPCHQCVRKGVSCLYEIPQSRRWRTGPGSKVSEADATAAVANTVPVPVTAASISSESLRSGTEAGKVRLGIERDDLPERHDHAQEVRSGASPDWSPLFQYLPSKYGANSMETNGMFSESSLSTITTTAMITTANEESFMSLLQNTWSNSVTNDFDFHLDNYTYNSGKELQLLSPALPTNTMFASSSSLSVPSPSMAVSINIPLPLSDPTLSGHFTKNKVQTSHRKTFVNMIVDMIHAYPRMMMRRETFPPFIHSCFPAGGNHEDGSRLPEHLTNCMGIAQLFAVCNDDTRLFVWGAIWAEMRGFRKRASMFDKYDAVSALQALLLYLIMRALDDVPQQVRHDYEMLLIHQEVLNRTMELTFHSIQAHERTSDLQWEDWIFAESNIRIGFFWFILGLVFHVHTGTPCFVSDHFREIPLPCSKTEWEAKTESQWRVEHENAAVRSRSTALRTFGDLVDAHRSPNGRDSESLDIWNAGIDHLGMILNLAVHLV